MTDLDQLDIMRRAITALGLGQVAPEELVASARASAAAREDARRLLSDANVRIKDLESALRDLGVNPGGDLPGEVRAIINRIAGDSAAAQHDLDCALRERDRAFDDARAAAARIKDLEAKIASNVAEAAARDMRIADLERDLDTARRETVATKTWGEGYQNALSLYFDKMGLNGAGSLDDRMAHVAKVSGAWAALTRICEVIGAPVPVCPDDAVEAAKHTHDAYVRVNTTLNDLSDFMRTVAPDALPPWTGADVVRAVEAVHTRATTAESELLVLRSALQDAGAPAVYDMPDDTERPIPDLERIRILGERLRTERGEREQEALRAQRHADHLRDAHIALDDRGVPRHADGVTLTLAARFRAYAAMVTTPTEDPSVALREWTRAVWGGDDTL